MTNYNHNGRLIFNINNNGDNYEAFDKAVLFIKSINNVNIIKYYAGGWDVSYLYFKLNNIDFELLFRDFGGTQLSVKENISNEDLQKVRQWALEIYNEVHKIK